MDFIQKSAHIYPLILDWKVEPLLSGHLKKEGFLEIPSSFHN